MSEEKKSKGWFSKVADVFTEEVTAGQETESNEEITVSNTGGEVIKDVGVSPTAGVSITPSGDGVFDQKFSDFLQGLISDNNIDGIDYFEFREALKGMSGLPNETKFQMAFDNFKIVDKNLSKETILKSIDHYVGILENEEKGFVIEMKEETDREVTAKQNKAKELTNDNKNILQEIQNLNEKIAHNQAEAVRLNDEAAHSQVKISQTGKNFTTTLAQVKSGLTTDKAMISELVKEVKTA